MLSISCLWLSGVVGVSPVEQDRCQSLLDAIGRVGQVLLEQCRIRGASEGLPGALVSMISPFIDRWAVIHQPGDVPGLASGRLDSPYRNSVTARVCVCSRSTVSVRK
jgi:hypothetical protein